jgi:hypothetical protein
MSDRPIELTGRLVFGLVVLTLGVLFTLGNLDLIDAHAIVRWWPSVLIVFGLAKLSGFMTRRHIAAGSVFTLLGAIWLGNELDVWSIDVFQLWPVFLIVAGGTLLMRGLRPGGASAERSGDPSEVVHSFALMSGSTRRVTSQKFAGGDASAVMGGVELDLRGAKLEGGRAIVDVFAMWGGIDIFVAPGWHVLNEGIAIMGAIEDSTKPAPDAGQTLVVRGFVLMGGVEIKNS